MPANRHLASRLASALTRLFGGEAGAGLLLILAPLIGGLGATLAVVLALLGAAALSGWIAARRWQAMTQSLSEEP